MKNCDEEINLEIFNLFLINWLQVSKKFKIQLISL